MTMMNHQHAGAAFRSAEAFAGAIRTMPEWEEWERARAAARTDPGLQQLLTHRRMLADRAQRASGSSVASLDAELERVRQQIVEHPVALRQQAAVTGLIGLLRELNVTLSGALSVDFAQLAAPARGKGCCG